MASIMECKYNQALRRARARCSYGRIMFLGTASVGKTSLRHGLMNQPLLPEKFNPTIPRPVKYNWVKAAGQQWTEVSEDNEISEEVQIVTTWMQSNSEPQDSHVSVSSHTEVDEHKTKVLYRLQDSEQSQSKADKDVLLSLWDCGGQPVFLDVLSPFLSSRTIFLLVFNASKCLDAPITKMSEITTLQKWMALIHTRFGGSQHGMLPNYPRVFLVGTHADQIAPRKPHEEQKRLASEVLNKLFASIKGKEYADMVLGGVVVDNTTAGMGPQADSGFKNIQEIVYSFVHDKLTIEIPVSWIHFRKVLQLYIKKQKPVIQLDEVYSIAAECYIPRDEVPIALLFYHDLGVFLFYPNIEGLKSVVILEPQWLVDQFGKLFASWKGKTEFSNMWNTLTHYGILVEPLCKAVLDNFCEHNLTPTALIEMLEHFLLAAPIVTTQLHAKRDQVKEYFVPFVLQHNLSQPPFATTSEGGKRRSLLSKSCDAQAWSSSLENAAPIHLTFLPGYVPPGYYVRLATSLASKQEVWLSFFSGIYHDQITMNIGVDRLTITEHIETIELQYSRLATVGEPFRESCRRLLLLLDECFSEVQQWLPGARPQLAFSCLECTRDAQPDILSRAKFCPFTLQQSVSYPLRCLIGHLTTLSDNHKLWLQIDALLPNSEFHTIFEEEMHLAKSIPPLVALDLAEQLEVDPVAAVIYQYRKIVGHNGFLSEVLSDMKLTTFTQDSSTKTTELSSDSTKELVSGQGSQYPAQESLCDVQDRATGECPPTDNDTTDAYSLSVYLSSLILKLQQENDWLKHLNMSQDYPTMDKLPHTSEKSSLYKHLEDQFDSLSGHCLGDRIQQQKSKLTTILSESREKNLQDEEMFKEEHQQQLLKVRLTEKVLENAVRAILCVDKATEGVVKLSGFDGNLEACKMELELAKISCHTKDDVISKLQKDNQAMQDKINTQPTLLPVNKAIQANYLAVAPGFLRGADVYGETVLEVVGDQPQKLEWPGYGFYIEVPEGALPPRVTASVGVKVILGGQFQFPEGSQLISALYWISSSEVFLKEVAVNIQHCAVIKNEEQCSTFRFIIAKCSQEVLPYRFRERAGVFNPHTQYGTIKLKQFSVAGVTAPADIETRCTAFMFYKEQTPSPNLIADFHFVVVKDIEPFLKGVNYEYQGWSKDSHSLGVCFSKTAVQLSQEEQEVDPWKIVPLESPSEITKADVTNFQPGRRIPHCAFELQLLSGKTLQRLFHKVDFTGVSSSNNFRIRYPQPEGNIVQAMPQPSKAATPPGSPHSSATDSSSQKVDCQELLKQPPTMSDLMNRVATKVTDNWEKIGILLDVPYSDIKTISRNTDDIVLRLAEVFDVWKKNGSPPYTWTTIIDALRAPLVGQVQLAKEVEEWVIESK